MISINNQAARIAQTQLDKNQKALGRSIERLSSGTKINSAKDDAAGQAISNRLTSQIRGQKQAVDNINDGISMARSAEDALSQINDRLQRVRELTVRGISGTMSPQDQDSVQSEINMNLQAIDRISQQTQFNGTNLLDGSQPKVHLQVGANDDDSLALGLGDNGFGVKALGLKDFVIAGLSGHAKLTNVVQGQARDIPVVDAKTDLSFVGPSGSNKQLVESDTPGYRGRMFTKSIENGQTHYYESGVSAHHDTDTRHNQVTVSEGAELYRHVQNIGNAKVESDNVSFKDSQGDETFSNASLVQTGGDYFIADDSGSGVRYYAADVSTRQATDSNGQAIKDDNGDPRYEITVRARSADSIAAPSFSAVDHVNGSSTITLDPKNVRVDYTNRDGQHIADALHLDKDGQYFLQGEPGNIGDDKGYRYATVVNSDSRGTLLKTRSGNGDLVRYYRMDKVGATTDVPNNQSVVTLREVGNNLQFKKPDDPLATLDRAIADVGEQRSDLGATQNRLESAIDLQQTATQNFSEARSRIRDTDYAHEVSVQSRAQILQQAGTAVLAQANQNMDSVLSLLRGGR